MPLQTKHLRIIQDRTGKILKLSGKTRSVLEENAYLDLFFISPHITRPARMSVQQPSELVRPNNHVIRQPTGPDGTPGFRLCR